MNRRQPYFDEIQREHVKGWWQALQPPDNNREAETDSPPASQHGFRFSRGDRAELRRAIGADELSRAHAAHLLAQRLVALEAGKSRPRFGDDGQVYERLLLVAGLLSHVRSHTAEPHTLALWLGRAAPREKGRGEQPPKMNATRFKRLLKMTSVDDGYRQLVRALKLADGRANLGQFADDAYAFFAEIQRPPASAADSVKLYWAHDYYLSAKDWKGANTDSDKE